MIKEMIPDLSPAPRQEAEMNQESQQYGRFIEERGKC
jgi:hypothetical protein